MGNCIYTAIGLANNANKSVGDVLASGNTVHMCLATWA